MPVVKSQEDKSEAHRNLQPKSIEKSSIQMIMMYDICGWKQGRIAEELGLTQSRVSIIMNSPLYIAERNKRRQEMQSQIIEEKVDKATSGDPVNKVFRDAAVEAAKKKVDLALNGKSEFVQNSASTDVLAHAGYKPEQKKTTVSVVVTDKIAERFERVMRMETEIDS